MKILWCDFDGVIVCNEMRNINTSNISPQEFAGLVTKAYNENPVTSGTIKKMMSEYQAAGATVNIITGRKESCLAEITEKIIRDHALHVDNIFYYPEEYAYVMSDYYAWKASVIGKSIQPSQATQVRIVDDDKGLLEHLRDNLIHDNLLLMHYEFFTDGRELMATV